ncbi:hypothetical protein C9994_14440 [Marivirga lumbricoides]|uniref:Phosphoglycerate mutase n=1 Tax=Marivirga lumbricoides TaxID=1046115 RepID=A0A2T4DEA6_9BACT|nr:hypothetical protein C9994_14440 [Marivirga lumbricoides]
MRNFIALLIVLMGITACNEKEKMNKTIYFVRHAEKETEIKNDPPLNTDGVIRSVDLASWFKKIKLDTVFSSDTKRNLETAKPLIEAKNLTLAKYDPTDFIAFSNTLKELNADTILVIGHSNTILEQIEALGAERPQASIGENEYDKIFELHLPSNKVLVHQYGSKSN